MILPLNNTLKDGTLVNKATLPALLRKKNTSSVNDFVAKIELCDDCGSPLVNGECSKCTKQILL